LNYTEANKAAWEEAFDRRDPSWGSDIVQQIKTQDYAFFRKDLADVLRRFDGTGKTIGQFCCNNGRELLSLVKSSRAKHGIGIDIAENQITFANEKARELGLPCDFVASDPLTLGTEFDERFDLVLLTIGVVRWFRDLNALFAKVSSSLKRGGVLILNEQHPVANMFGCPVNDHVDARLVHSYFSKETTSTNGMTYITQKPYSSKPFVEYTHPLGRIINALCRANLNLCSLTEYDYDLSDDFVHLDGRGIPLSLIMEARKR